MDPRYTEDFTDFSEDIALPLSGYTIQCSNFSEFNAFDNSACDVSKVEGSEEDVNSSETVNKPPELELRDVNPLVTPKLSDDSALSEFKPDFNLECSLPVQNNTGDKDSGNQELNESSSVNNTTVVQSLYGDDDIVTDTFIPSLTPKSETPPEQKPQDGLRTPDTPTLVLQNQVSLIKTPPNMVPSVLNRNKFSSLKKPLLSSTESEVIQDISQPESPVSPAVRTGVLKKEQIMKRLQSFSLLKQGIQPLPIKRIAGVKPPKVQIQIGEAYDENGRKIDEKLMIIKKPPKQGPTPDEKAKAVIDEIEKIKKQEAAMLTSYIDSKYLKHGFVTKTKIPNSRVHSIKEDTAEKFSHDSPKPDRHSSTKDKRYEKDEGKNYRRRSSERENKYDKKKSDKPKEEESTRDWDQVKKKYPKNDKTKDDDQFYDWEHKKKYEKNEKSKFDEIPHDVDHAKKHDRNERDKEIEMPGDWALIKKEHIEFKTITKLKEKIFNPLDKIDKRPGVHKRFQDDEKNVNNKKEEHIKPQLMFEFPSLPRHPLVAQSVKGTDKLYPPEIINYTKNHPTVTYCENPTVARGYNKTRKQVLSEIPQERSEIMLQIIEHKTSAIEPFAISAVRKWYSKNVLTESYQETTEESESVIPAPVTSYGLSVLSKCYDNPEENDETTTEEHSDIEKLDKLKSKKKKDKKKRKKAKKSRKSKSKSKERTSKGEVKRENSEKSKKEDSEDKEAKNESFDITAKEETRIEAKESLTSLTSPISPAMPTVVDKTITDKTVVNKDVDNKTPDKTPNTDEYRSNWESDEDILTEIMCVETRERPYEKPYHRPNSHDRKWESDEEIPNKYDKDRKHDYDYKYTSKRRSKSSSEKLEDKHIHTKHGHDEKKERKLLDSMYYQSFDHKKSSDSMHHQTVDHKKSSDTHIKADVEHRSRHSLERATYNKWSSEEDLNKSSSKHDNKKRLSNYEQKPEKSKVKIAKPTEETLNFELIPKHRSQWSSDEEFEKRRVSVELDSRKTKNKNDDRFRSRWEDEHKLIESDRYRNKDRVDDIFDHKLTDSLSIREYDRRSYKLTDNLLPKSRRSTDAEDFYNKIHNNLLEEKLKEEKRRIQKDLLEEKLKEEKRRIQKDLLEEKRRIQKDLFEEKFKEEKKNSKSKDKWKEKSRSARKIDKKPKVRINYSDLEDNLEEELRLQNEKDLLKRIQDNPALHYKSKIKIDYADFDNSLIKSKENFRERKIEESAEIIDNISSKVTENTEIKENVRSTKDDIASPKKQTEENISEDIEPGTPKKPNESLGSDTYTPPTKKDSNIRDIQSPVITSQVNLASEISPVAAPVLPIPAPTIFPETPKAENNSIKLASEYEEFMKAVCFDEPKTPPTEHEQKDSHTEKSKSSKAVDNEEMKKLAEKKKDSLNEILEEKEIDKTADKQSSEPTSDSETSCSSTESDSSDSASSDHNSSSDSESNPKEPTLIKIKTEKLSDTEKEIENYKLKPEKRKRRKTSDSSGSNEPFDKHLKVVVKTEKDTSEESDKVESHSESVDNDKYKKEDEYKKGKYDREIDWETTYTRNSTHHSLLYDKTDEFNTITPLKRPIIDITEMMVPSMLPENIPLPGSTPEVIAVVETPPGVQSPKEMISINTESQSMTPVKKARSFIPIKLLTAETRKQANETAKLDTEDSLGFGKFAPIEGLSEDMNKANVSFSESPSTPKMHGASQERADPSDYKDESSRKRQSQWSINISPAKKPLLQTEDVDSDEDFTDKFYKQSETKKVVEKDQPRKTTRFDVEVTENIDKQEVRNTAVEEASRKTSKYDDSHTKHETEPENRSHYGDRSYERNKHSPESKHDKPKSDKRSPSINKSDKKPPRRLSPNRRKRGRDSLEKKRERSRERTNRESLRDREKRRLLDRRLLDRRQPATKGRNRLSREKEVNRSRCRDRSKDRGRPREQERERSRERDRDRDHRDADRERGHKRDEHRRYSRSPSPRRDRRSSLENIPFPRPLDDTDFSTTSMDIVQSPFNSPLDGFKRSLADSTISDSELVTLHTPDESNERSPLYNGPPRHYYQPQVLPPKSVDSPSSPKRISLDDRINLVLGIEKEPPKPIDTVCSRVQYNNPPNYDPYAYSRAEYDMYNAPQNDGYGAASYSNQYQHQQPYYPNPNQMSNENNMKVVQVGNVIQVVPTEQPNIPPPVIQHVPQHPKVNELPPKVVQVGNMLQIVPMSIMESSGVESPVSHVTVTATDQRRADKEKRRLEREQRRKEKERKRKEKEKRKQLKIKLKTENMIKRALMLETGEGDSEIANVEVETSAEALDSNNLPLAWPPASVLIALPLPKPPTRGILMRHGFKSEKDELEGEEKEKSESRKVVKFADGICPGEGTSPSGGEDRPSPPPPPKKLPKEKRYKKIKMQNKNKKKIKLFGMDVSLPTITNKRRDPRYKEPEQTCFARSVSKLRKTNEVKIIRTQQATPDEDDESEDNLPPPPPPPGSPPPHLWPPRIKHPPLNNIHPSLAPATVVYPPPPPPPPPQHMQQLIYPPQLQPQLQPPPTSILAHAPPPPRLHHPSVIPVLQPHHHGPPFHQHH